MSLYVQETGPTNAPTIVFIHGGGVSGWMWQPQIERLPDYHCLVPDLPEQGKSTDAGPFTIASAAEQLADLIAERAHGGKAHVVGLSIGAQVALALLAHAPERVDRAILSSALVRPIPGGKMFTPKVVALSYRWFMAPFNNNDWWIKLNMKYSAGVPDEYYPQFKQSFQEATESGFSSLLVENQRFRLPRGLEIVKVPTLVVSGQHEKGAMHQSMLDIAGVLPNAKAYEVHHPAKMSMAEEHNWSLTAPDLFTETVRAWLSSDPLPEALKAA